MSISVESINIVGGVIGHPDRQSAGPYVAPLLKFPIKSIIPDVSVIDRYLIRENDRSAVMEFLTDHDDVLALLPEAERVIRRHFSKDDASIRLYLDDDDPRDNILFMQIQTSLEVDEAIDRTLVLDDEWYATRRPLALVINLAVQ